MLAAVLLAAACSFDWEGRYTAHFGDGDGDASAGQSGSNAGRAGDAQGGAAGLAGSSGGLGGASGASGFGFGGAGAGGVGGGTGGAAACCEPGCTTVTETWGENSTDDHRNVTADAFIEDVAPGDNFGRSRNLFADAGPATRVGLLRFDLSALPPSTVVCASTLRLHVGSNSSNDTITFHQVLEDWEPGNQSGSSGIVNWQMRLPPAVGWSSPGCGAPASCAAAEVGSVVPSGVQNERYDVAIDVALVQGWVGGAIPNHGVALKLNLGTNGARFRSSDHDDGLRPALELVVAMP